MKDIFKALIPEAARELPILAGPLGGGVFIGSPRASLRKVMGLYEHELNPWLVKALPRVNTLLDVGANDGYFAFGCAAAFRRKGLPATILCFEPEGHYCELLERSAERYRGPDLDIVVIDKFVGASDAGSTDTIPLASISDQTRGGQARALIKIDVEGAELEVLRDAGHWLSPQHLFLIEVHAESLIAPIRALLEDHGVALQQVDQSAHWLLGREQRDIDNRWLVSVL